MRGNNFLVWKLFRQLTEVVERCFHTVTEFARLLDAGIYCRSINLLQL